MPRSQLLDAAEDRSRARNHAQPQVILPRRHIELARYIAGRQDCLEFRGKKKALSVAEKIERLDAQAVAGQEEPPLRPVPQCKCEHPPQALDQPLATLFVQMNEHFSVATGG